MPILVGPETCSSTSPARSLYWKIGMRSKPYIEADHPQIEEPPVVTRKLKISADVWIDILTNGREHHFRVSKNALPEDAECVGIDWERPPGNNPPTTLILNI